MTAKEMNVEMLRNMSIIAENESLLKRATKLVAEMQADSTLLSKEEFLRRVDEGREQIRRGECVQFSDRDEMNKWLNSL